MSDSKKRKEFVIRDMTNDDYEVTMVKKSVNYKWPLKNQPEITGFKLEIWCKKTPNTSSTDKGV
ncbi:hypothetical protein [Leuconostoc citreum]|uniref:hypothetical protein n=1 Tax=Leuconostoc citreum TaxID=33964 RepID=UPI0032DEFD35